MENTAKTPSSTATLVMITGATRGIGRLAAEAAARRGARVVLACRDRARGEETREEIAAIASGPPPELLVLDLASLASVRRAAAEARERFPRIDVLVNNAGTSSHGYAQTVDGFELCMGTNFLGPFLFTNLLLPAMATAGRIINLSSAVYPMGRASLESPDHGGVWGGFMNYAASKRALLQFSLALAEREGRRGAEGLRVNALHPGVVRTDIMRIRRWYGFLVDIILAPFWTPAEKGVAMILDLALSDRYRDATGGWYKAGRLTKVKPGIADPRRLEELWEAGAGATGLDRDPGPR